MFFPYILAVSFVSLPLSGLAAPLEARHEHHFGGAKTFAAVAVGQSGVPSAVQHGAAHPLEKSLHGMGKALTLAVVQHNASATDAYWAQQSLFKVMESARRLQHGGNATHPVNATHVAQSLVEGVHKLSQHYSAVMTGAGGIQSLIVKLPARFAVRVQNMTAVNVSDATRQFLGEHGISVQSLGVDVPYLNGVGNATFGHHHHEGPSLGTNATQTAIFLATPPTPFLQGYSQPATLH